MTYLQKARARLHGCTLIRDEAGLSTVEYVIILVLIAAIAMGTWKQFGEKVKTGLVNAGTAFDDSVGKADTSGQGTATTTP